MQSTNSTFWNNTVNSPKFILILILNTSSERILSWGIQQCIVYLLNGNKGKNKIDKYLQILLLERQIEERVISLLG